MQIACDESGHTGPDLLNKDQRIFAYTSVNLSDDDAWSIIDKAKKSYPVQMPELKASQLLKTANGRKLVFEIVKACEGRIAINAHDKLLALCGWIFEYIYEPVYKEDPSLLYKKNMHRFVAMFCWMWFNSDNLQASEAIIQFQKYMRSKNISDAPIFFESKLPALEKTSQEEPFNLLIRFASGYRNLISVDNSTLGKVLPENGKWVLDLSTSALWSHLNFWGKKGEPLSVNCDVSKPLQATASSFKGDETDPAIQRARIMGNTDRLGWKLAKPILFADSRNHPAIQIADIIGGIAVHAFSSGFPSDLVDLSSIIKSSMMRDSIFPDKEVIDLKQRGPAVNYLALYDLAKRAEVVSDPYQGLAEFYRLAEIGWVQGNFKFAID
jgi:Protein of unknown function (DUF3800)